IGLPNWLPTGEEWMKLPFVAFLGAYIFVVFGFLSRRCERQADVFGCRAVSCGRADCTGHDEGWVLDQIRAGSVSDRKGHVLCPTGIQTFISALEKVASVNG